MNDSSEMKVRFRWKYVSWKSKREYTIKSISRNDWHLLIITNNQYRRTSAKCNMIQLSAWSSRHNLLTTDSRILVQVYIKNMCLSINCNTSKDGTWVRCPCNISNLWFKIKNEKRYSWNKKNEKIIRVIGWNILKISYNIIWKYHSY